MFSLQQHGSSGTTLRRRVGGLYPLLFVCTDAHGASFGALVTAVVGEPGVAGAAVPAFRRSGGPRARLYAINLYNSHHI
jgi:hypothetical protein